MPGSPGEALNTLRDDVDEVVGVMAWLADQIAIFTYTAIAMALMLRIDVRITLLALLPLVVVILVSRATSARAERYRKATREATARVNGALTEILGAVQAIKVACAEPHATAHLDKLGQRRQHAIVRDRALNQLIISLCEEAGTLTAGMVLMLGASRIRNQTLTVGDFALLITSLDSITMFIVESGGFTAYFKQVGVALSASWRSCAAGRRRFQRQRPSICWWRIIRSTCASRRPPCPSPRANPTTAWRN